MSRVVRRMKAGDEVRYGIHCPGCDEVHVMNDGWEFNQDYEKPTFKPSLLVSGYNSKSKPFTCHSFIENGNIRFLKDSTHELAGQTIPLPSISDD